MTVGITRCDIRTYDKPPKSTVWVLHDGGWKQYKGVRFDVPLTVCEGTIGEVARAMQELRDSLLMRIHGEFTHWQPRSIPPYGAFERLDGERLRCWMLWVVTDAFVLPHVPGIVDEPLHDEPMVNRPFVSFAFAIAEEYQWHLDHPQEALPSTA